MSTVSLIRESGNGRQVLFQSVSISFLAGLSGGDTIAFWIHNALNGKLNSSKIFCLDNKLNIIDHRTMFVLYLAVRNSVERKLSCWDGWHQSAHWRISLSLQEPCIRVIFQNKMTEECTMRFFRVRHRIDKKRAGRFLLGIRQPPKMQARLLLAPTTKVSNVYFGFKLIMFMMTDYTVLSGQG